MPTPDEAADLLGISRPMLLRLIDSGQIAAEQSPGGDGFRLRSADVLDFQARRELRREGVQAISEIVEEYDLPY